MTTRVYVEMDDDKASAFLYDIATGAFNRYGITGSGYLEEYGNA